MWQGDEFTDEDLEYISGKPEYKYKPPDPHCTYQCLCGFTAGTMAALQKHFDKYPDSDFNEQGDGLDEMRARYGRIHKPVASTWAAHQESQLAIVDRAYGEELFRRAQPVELERAVYQAIDEQTVMTVAGLQDRPTLCCCLHSEEAGGWMVGLSEDSVTNHIEIEVRAKMQQQAKAQREKAKEDAVLAREQEIQADRSEAFMAPFNDGSLSHMATYSSGSSWTETVGGETWRDHAKVLLQLYEEGRFVFKVRHWSEDDSGLESFEHENAWYSGNFGRTGEGSVLRMSVVGCAKNIDASSGMSERVEMCSTVFEAVAAYSIKGEELLRLQGRIPSAIARRKGLDELKFNSAPPLYL